MPPSATSTEPRRPAISDEAQFSVTFNRQALVRNDVRSLNASLQSGIQNGYLSQNEARKAIGLNPIPGGDTYMVNSALAPVAGKEPNAA